MNDTLDAVLTRLLGKSCHVLTRHSVGGGCISDAMRIEASIEETEPVSFFVKRNVASMEENFCCESLGLSELTQTGSIRVPTVIATGRVDDQAWLITEWVESSRKTSAFFESFGRQLAALHRSTLGDAIGWHRDNFLGAAKQINTPSDSWTGFVAEHRIGFQIRWANDQGSVRFATACGGRIGDRPNARVVARPGRRNVIATR